MLTVLNTELTREIIVSIIGKWRDMNMMNLCARMIVWLVKQSTGRDRATIFAKKCGRSDFSKDEANAMREFIDSHTTSEYIDKVNSYLEERSKVSFVNDISIMSSGLKYKLVIKFENG